MNLPVRASGGRLFTSGSSVIVVISPLRSLTNKYSIYRVWEFATLNYVLASQNAVCQIKQKFSQSKYRLDLKSMQLNRRESTISRTDSQTNLLGVKVGLLAARRLRSLLIQCRATV